MTGPTIPSPAGATGDFDPPSPEATALLEGLRAGSASAFEELVRTHADRVLAVARRIVGNEDDALDVVQETFTNAFRKIATFGGGSSVSTWIYRIAMNAALMKVRTKKRRHEVAIEDLLPRFLEDGHQEMPPAEWRRTESSAAERTETCTLVRRLIDRLPRDYRTVLILRDIEELSTAETAALLGISENAVKVRLHRARQALRELLDPHRRQGEV